MANTITAPVTVDPDDLAQIAFDDLATSTPGWLPSDADPTSRILQAFAAIVAEWMAVTAQVPNDIVLFFGTYMLGVPPYAATYAATTATATVVDANGPYTIPAGAAFGLQALDRSGLVTFYNQNDVVIPHGSTTSSAGAVVLIAADAGVASSGLSGAVTDLGRLSSLDHLTLVGATTGGLDAETSDAYLQRYGDIAPLLTARPITPSDFEAFARAFSPEVYRARALDLYNATDGTSGNEKCTTVAVTNLAGLPISSPGKAALLALYQSKLTVNFLVFVIDATYTTIDVSFTGVCDSSYDATDVNTRAQAAVAAALSPAIHGLPDAGDQRLWLDRPKIRFQDISAVLNNVEGFDYWTALTIGIHSGTMGTSDITLATPLPLPVAGTISGTTTAP